MRELHAIYPLGEGIEVQFAITGMKEALQTEVLVRMAQDQVEQPTLEQVLEWGEQMAPRTMGTTLGRQDSMRPDALRGQPR